MKYYEKLELFVLNEQEITLLREELNILSESEIYDWNVKKVNDDSFMIVDQYIKVHIDFNEYGFKIMAEIKNHVTFFADHGRALSLKETSDFLTEFGVAFPFNSIEFD